MSPSWSSRRCVKAPTCPLMFDPFCSPCNVAFLGFTVDIGGSGRREPPGRGPRPPSPRHPSEARTLPRQPRCETAMTLPLAHSYDGVGRSPQQARQLFRHCLFFGNYSVYEVMPVIHSSYGTQAGRGDSSAGVMRRPRLEFTHPSRPHARTRTDPARVLTVATAIRSSHLHSSDSTQVTHLSHLT
jgi:hypothetical protein